MKKSGKHSEPKADSLVERRDFLSGAATLAGTSLLGLGLSSANAATAAPSDPAAPAASSPSRGASPAPSPAAAQPTLDIPLEHRTTRWQDQRWLLDAVIQTVGIEWDQGRLGTLVAMCGPEIQGDVAAIRARVRKFNDLSREFARPAVRREKQARDFESQGHTVSARDQYFMAALLYSLAQWSIFENSRENLALNDRKNACYAKYMQYADHEVRRVEVPFAGKTLPGYLHLPPNRTGRVPCVWSISGLDSTKEYGAALSGDKMRDRGIATLALEGPGQAECAIREIFLTRTNWQEAGPTVLSWMRAQKEIDPDRIALRGVSLGTSLASHVASVDSKLSGVVVQAMTHEPHFHSAFETASPTFKLRFMYYTGIQTEAEMNKFLESWDIMGLAAKIKSPYLAVAGEDDQLSRIEYTYQFFENLAGPKQLLVYEGAEHGVLGSAAVANGPNVATYMADWLADRFAGKPTETKHMKVDAAGAVHESSFEDARKSLSLMFL